MNTWREWWIEWPLLTAVLGSVAAIIVILLIFGVMSLMHLSRAQQIDVMMVGTPILAAVATIGAAVKAGRKRRTL